MRQPSPYKKKKLLPVNFKPSGHQNSSDFFHNSCFFLRLEFFFGRGESSMSPHFFWGGGKIITLTSKPTYHPPFHPTLEPKQSNSAARCLGGLNMVMESWKWKCEEIIPLGVALTFRNPRMIQVAFDDLHVWWFFKGGSPQRS